MADIVRSPEARDDAAEIWAYIGADNPLAADTLADLFEVKLAMLAEFPGVGSKRDELREGLRSFCVQDYILFYREIRNGIELVRVLHGMRDIPSEFLA